MAGLITHPFDVIKTHRQLDLGESLFGSVFLQICLLKSMHSQYRIIPIQINFFNDRYQLILFSKLTGHIQIAVYQLISVVARSNVYYLAPKLVCGYIISPSIFFKGKTYSRSTREALRRLYRTMGLRALFSGKGVYMFSSFGLLDVSNHVFLLENACFLLCFMVTHPRCLLNCLGLTPRLLKTTTASATMISVFEIVKQNLQTWQLHNKSYSAIVFPHPLLFDQWLV